MTSKGNTYQQVILVALKKVEETGQIPQSLTSLSDATGLSSSDIQQSFESVDALRTGLIDHGITLLADTMGQAIARACPDDPKAQLRALSRAFFEWGGANRALFGLLASALMDPAISKGSILDMHRHSIGELVRRKLNECLNRGMIPAEAPLGLYLAGLHSTILGISSMLIHNRLDPWYDGPVNDLTELSNQMMDMFIDKLIPGTT